MGYSNPEYQARPLIPVAFNATSTATMTASDHVVTNATVAVLPKFTRRTKLNKIRVRITTAPNTNSKVTKLLFLNGTSTIAVATIGTNTAGATVDATMVAANQIVAADVEPTLSVVSTATASTGAVTQGNYNIYFEQQEEYA